MGRGTLGTSRGIAAATSAAAPTNSRPAANKEHPTMKPVPLVGHLIKNNSKPGQIVLDLFGGSGSTLIACEQMNRRCFTMEYDPQYADVIIDRWQQFTGREAVKLN